MPRAYCDDIVWDKEDPEYDQDLPTDVSVWLDEDYDPDYEPKETVEREFGCRLISFHIDHIAEV